MISRNKTKKITNKIHTWKKTSPQAKARLTSSSHENSPSYLRKIHLLEKLPQRFSLSGVFPSSLPQKPPQNLPPALEVFTPQKLTRPPFFFFFFFLIPLFVSSSASHYRLSYSPVSEHVVSQPPAWSATSLPVHAAHLLCREGVPPLA